MTVAFLACAMVTLCTLFYVFYLPGKLHMGPDKTRLAYLQERKDAVYENFCALVEHGRFRANSHRHAQERNQWEARCRG